MTFPPPGPPPGQPVGPPPGPPPGPPHPEQPTQRITRPEAAPEPETPARRWWAGDPLSVVLVFVIVTAIALAGLLGGELFARHKADSIVAKAVSCVVKDNAEVSFGLRPFLLQHLSRTYSGLSVRTAGNQIREAKGMKLDLRLDDVHINPTADSAGTLGALDANVTWSSDGIKQTVQDIIPVLGGLVSDVSTEPSSGTIEVRGGLGALTIKPRIDYGKLSLQVMGLSGLGFALPRETVQPALDAFTNALTDNLPMGIHADGVEVTDSGVTARFVTTDATIPNGQQDPCFAGI